MFVNSGKELIEICNEKKISIGRYTLNEEISESQKSQEEIWEKMRRNLLVMKESSKAALEKNIISVSGLTGGDAFRLSSYISKGDTICGEFLNRAMARAISSSEVNASMGRIVAAPTAGSCGIIPAVILSVGEKIDASQDDMILALFTASAVGILIAKNATLSGAEGGCQAECGSAAAMACAAAIEMLGGSPEMALQGGAITIKNVLGLVCDPIAGLVEAPCTKRNISGTVNALTTIDLVMAGIKSIIPFDEVVSAMYRIGKSMPCELRETAEGGLAATPTGIRLKERVAAKA